MARVTRPRAARPMKLFKLALCTPAAAFKPEMVAGAELLVGFAARAEGAPVPVAVGAEKVPVPVAPYKKVGRE